MRSIFLEGIVSKQLASDGLAAEFPGQTGSTIVLRDLTEQHSVGYLYVGEVSVADDQLGPYLIQGDYSGRAAGFDPKQIVREALTRIQRHTGGELRDYGD